MNNRAIGFFVVESEFMEDYLVKALAFNGQVRAYAVCSTETSG